ncbi:unnamed protein product [Rhizophagus irregularis]|nr:unnamed protein product [Rhizophagus irregularis]
MENEKTETILNIGKEDNQITQQHIEDEDKPKDDTPPHNGEEIDRSDMTEVSEDELFAVTYSKKDKSVVGWLINVKNGIELQRLGTCSNIEIPTETVFVLNEKDLLLYNDDTKYASLISFKSDNVTARRIKVEINFNSIRKFKMDFLPNGDLILVSSMLLIFLYSRANLSSPQLLYKIKFQSSDKYEVDYVNYYILQTKLFIFNDGCLTQWDLPLSPQKTLKKKMHYDLTSNSIINIVINKNQTLLASCVILDDEFKTDIYSMKTGNHISRYVSKSYFPLKFITLKDTERLILIERNNSGGKVLQKILDPFDTKSYIDANGYPLYHIISTESNKQLFFDKTCHSCRRSWLSKDKFNQLLNMTTTIYYGDIYTSTIFKTIRNMFERINNIVDFPVNYEIKPGKLFRFNLEKVDKFIEKEIKVEGFVKDNNDWKKTQSSCISTGELVLYEQVSDQALILITTCGIYIFTIVENSLRLRYFWNNKKLNDYYSHSITNNFKFDKYKENIKEILKSELFKDSLPSPSFDIFKTYTEYHYLIEGIINDPKDCLEFVSELFEIEKERNSENGVKLIFDIIIELIEMANSQQLPVINQYMEFINLKLPELSDRYSSLVIKYILRTSILLDSSCASFKNSKKTSLYAYSKDPYIKRTNRFIVFLLDIFSSIYKFSSQTSKEDLVQTISFIVPFPGIWKYQKGQKDQKDQNYWNEIIYKPISPWNIFIYKQKSILFCNIDSNNFYQCDQITLKTCGIYLK